MRRSARTRPPRASQRCHSKPLMGRSGAMRAVAKAKIEACRRDYDASRPHSALERLTPQEFVARTARKGRP